MKPTRLETHCGYVARLTVQDAPQVILYSTYKNRVVAKGFCRYVLHTHQALSLELFFCLGLGYIFNVYSKQ